MAIRRGNVGRRCRVVANVTAILLTALPAAAEPTIPAALANSHDLAAPPAKAAGPTPVKVPARPSAPATARVRSAAASRPAAPSESPEAARLRAEIAALRLEMAELRAVFQPPAPPAVRAEDLEDKSRREALSAERKATSDKLDSIRHAVAAGLDPSLVEESMAKLQKRSGEIDAELAVAPGPGPASAEPAPTLREVPREMRRMSDSLMALHLQIASLDHRERGLDLDPAPASSPAASQRDAPEPEKPAPSKKVGVVLDLGVASLYAFRGLNLFKHAGQNEANALFAPAITWAIGETGMSLGYVGAYQWTGSNRSALVEAGIGHEQDLIVGYTRALSARVSGNASLTYYAYPFAKKSVAGTALPSYLEPGVSASYAGDVDVGLALSFFAGVQEALAASRYAYVRPSVGKTISVTSAVDVALLGGLGVKLYPAARPTNDNMVDLALDLQVRFKAGDRAYVAPAVHYGWTNLAGLGVADEQMVWGSLNTGLSL